MPVEIPGQPPHDGAADANGLSASSPNPEKDCSLTLTAAEGPVAVAAAAETAKPEPAVTGDPGPISPSRPRNKAALRELKHLQTDAAWQAETPDLRAGRTRRSSTAAASDAQQQQAQTAPRAPKRPRTSGGGGGAANGADGTPKRRKSAPGGPSAAPAGSSIAAVEADASTVAATGNAAADAAASGSPAGTTSPEAKQQKGSKKQPKQRAGKRTSSGAAVEAAAASEPDNGRSKGDAYMHEALAATFPSAKQQIKAPHSETDTADPAMAGPADPATVAPADPTTAAPADPATAGPSKAAASKPKSRSRSRTNRAASETGNGSAGGAAAAEIAAGDNTAADAAKQAEAAGAGVAVRPAADEAVPMDAVGSETQRDASADGPAAAIATAEDVVAASKQATAAQQPSAAQQPAAAEQPASAQPADSSPAAADAADQTAAETVPAAAAGVAKHMAAEQPTTAAIPTTAMATAAADPAVDTSTAEPKPAAVSAGTMPEVKAESEAEVKAEAAAQPAKAEPLSAGTAGAASGHEWQTMAQQLAEKVKHALRNVPAPSGNYKIASLLRCGVLTGEEVQYRRAAGGGAQQLLRGVIASDGNIQCFCDRCKGAARQPNSVFEEHAGSKVRRPAQFTYLVKYNLSLKELGTLVNSSYMDSHISYCVQCKDGGDLMCCDGCPAAYHPACLGLEDVPNGAWFCPACVQAGREPPGYRESEVFKMCQKGMENLRQQMTKARQAGGAGLANLPPVAPPGYNKLGSSVGVTVPGSPPAASAGSAPTVRSSARASARTAAAALAAAAKGDTESGDGASGDADDDSSGSGRGRGRGRGFKSNSSRGKASSRGRGGRMRIVGGAVIGLDELDSLEGFVDPGRVRMACPQRMGGTGARRERNNNKHKRLFTGEPGALEDNQPLFYKTAADGMLLRSGAAVINPNGVSGIRCDCCNQVVSCSQFEAHAGRGARRAPYDFIFTEDGLSLRRLAERLPHKEGDAPLAPLVARKGVDYARRAANRRAIWGDYEEEQEQEEFTGPPEVVHDTDGLGSGCVLCHEPDFLRGAFGDRTIMICDTCEREFHVGCLRDYGRADLKEVPEGDWFCSGECSKIKVQLGSWVRAGEQPLGPGGAHSWHVLRGFKHSAGRVEMSMRASMSILQGSFDPIMDANNNMDLLPLIIQAKAYREWDFSNMLTVLLRFNGRAVAAAVVRVFGSQLAELPLVATRPDARRLGHARVLVRAVEATLIELGVQALALPAAESARNTWIHGFGFSDMSEEQQAHVKRDLRMLIFPGTSLLVKSLYKDPDAVTDAAAAAAADEAANPGLSAASDPGVLAACQATVEAASKAAAEASAEAAAKAVPAVVIPAPAAGTAGVGPAVAGQQLPLHFMPNGISEQQQQQQQPHQQLLVVGQFGSVSQLQQPQHTVQHFIGMAASTGTGVQQHQQQENAQQSQQQQQQQEGSNAAAGPSSSTMLTAGSRSNTWAASAGINPGVTTALTLPSLVQVQQQQPLSMLQITAPGTRQLLPPQQQGLQQQQVSVERPLDADVPVQGVNGPLSPGRASPRTSSLGRALGISSPPQQQQAAVQQQQGETATQPDVPEVPAAPKPSDAPQHQADTPADVPADMQAGTHTGAPADVLAGVQAEVPADLQQQQAPQQQPTQQPGIVQDTADQQQPVIVPCTAHQQQPVAQRTGQATEQTVPAAEQAGQAAEQTGQAADAVGRQSVAASEDVMLVDMPAMPRTSGGLS